MIILGIESSCDETATAIVEDGQFLLSQAIESQVDIHAQYGGVVPEVASRSHLEAVIPVVSIAIKKAFPGVDKNAAWGKIDAIAVSHGPGLSGGLLVGTLTARTLAMIYSKPLYGINHVLGHTYANWLSDKQPEFPVLSLTASGGHTQLVLLESHTDYKLLGQTRDDAAGEAFDKVAKMLGLPYPGGPNIAQAAQKGDPTKYKLPKASMDNKYDFSFSGLKTAVLRKLQIEIGGSNATLSTQIADKLTDQQVYDFAASFQQTVVETLTGKLLKANEEFAPESIVIGGGVAANQQLRDHLSTQGLPKLSYTDIALCTDNAAMIACLAYYQSQYQEPVAIDDLLVSPSLSL